MTSLAHFTWRQYSGAVLGAMLLCAAPVHAMEVAPADVQAAVRTLGFLDSLQRHASIAMGVVYRAGDAESKALARRTAAVLAATKAPNGSSIDTNVVAVNELELAGRRFDVIFLVLGIAEDSRPVAEFVRRQHVLSISNDPACLTSECCVLMVHAGARTEIVLNTSLAEATGATFSSVFMMMVKRR
jgi:hypothetical protein